MTWRTNSALGVVAFALLIVCALDAKYGKTTLEAEFAARSIFEFEEGAISRYRIVHGTENFLMEKGKDGLWYIREPVIYRADQPVAEGVPFNVRTLRKIHTIPVVAGADLSSYGLAESAARVLFSLGEREEEIRLGEKDPEGNVYLQSTSIDGEIYTVSPSVAESVRRDMDEFREKRLLPFETYNVDAIGLERAPWRMQWVKEDGAWKVSNGPFTDFADEEKVDEILRRLQGLQALEFADGVTDDQLADFGLGEKATTDRSYIALRLKTDTGMETVELGQPIKRGGRGVCPARVVAGATAGAGPSTILFVHESALADFGRPLRDFRSRKALHFSRLEAQEITYEAGKKTFLLSKADGVWVVKQPHEVIADEDEVRVLLRLLEDLPISQFVEDEAKDLTPFGLEVWARKITVKTLDGEATIYLGRTTDEGDFFAKRPEGRSVFAVRPVGLPPTATEAYFRVLRKRVVTFSTFDAEELTVRSGDEERRFDKVDGKWYLQGDPDDRTPVRDAILVLSSLSAVRFVEEGGDPAAYGLTEPSLEAVVSLGGERPGEVYTLWIGTETVDGYYAQLEGSEMIFLADKAVVHDLQGLVVSPDDE